MTDYGLTIQHIIHTINIKENNFKWEILNSLSLSVQTLFLERKHASTALVRESNCSHVSRYDNFKMF